MCNKTIIEFGFHDIMNDQTSFLCYLTQTSVLIINDILLNLIQ